MTHDQPMTNPNHVVFVWHVLRATGYGLVCFGAWGAENNAWSWGGHGVFLAWVVMCYLGLFWVGLGVVMGCSWVGHGMALVRHEWPWVWSWLGVVMC